MSYNEGKKALSASDCRVICSKEEPSVTAINDHAFRFDFDDDTLFGNDAGEDEDLDVLASYFVDQPAFRLFLDRKSRLGIAPSRKGMGKSALISKLNFDLIGDDVLIVRLTGSQLAGSNIPEFGSLLEAQNYWVNQMCLRVNAALGSAIGFAFTDTQMSLVEAAELSGLKERNLIGSLLSRIKTSKIPIEIMAPSPVENAEALLKRATESRKDQVVWLLVDDIDASFKDTDRQQLLVSSFFSACRFIAREMTGVHVRATVRSDVWSNLRANEDLDKCEQYITDIYWTKNELKVILSKKIFAWVERKIPDVAKALSYNFRVDADSIIELAFDRRMRWGSHRVPPFQAINILAAGRPRWMSQLSRLAGRHASRKHRWRVSIADINETTPAFTRYRLNDLYKEHSHQFVDIEKLIQAFQGAPVRYTTDQLLTRINKYYIGPVGASRIPDIDGDPYNSPLQLAHFLFKCGFLIARTPGEKDTRLVKFITHAQSPELLRHSGNPGEYLWEIYPSFRQRAKLRDIEVSYLSEDGDLEDLSETEVS